MFWMMVYLVYKVVKRYCINGSDLYGDFCLCLRFFINLLLMFDSFLKLLGLFSVDFVIKVFILNLFWIVLSFWCIVKEVVFFMIFLLFMFMKGFWIFWVFVR